MVKSQQWESSVITCHNIKVKCSINTHCGKVVLVVEGVMVYWWRLVGTGWPGGRGPLIADPAGAGGS